LVSWIEKMTEIGLEKRFSKARDAASALKSGNIQRADEQIGNLRKNPKPHNSRIELSKSAKELNIKIPPTLVQKPFFYTVVGMFLAPYSLSILLAVLALNLSIGLVICAIIIGWLIKYLFQRNVINFNRNDFEIKYQIFGWNYWRHRGEVSQILGVFIYNNSFGRNQIRIRSGNNNTGTYFYLLGSNLKDIEAVWLAQEIQDWLNLR